MKVCDARVLVPSVRFLAVHWNLADCASPESVRITITRSGKQAALAELPGTARRFVDENLPERNRWPRIEYTIRAKNVVSGDTASASARLVPPENRHGLAWADQLRLRLKTTHGTRCWHLPRKSFGERCPDCYDTVRQRVVRSNCEVCYGTTYVGGYDDPEEIFVGFRASPEVRQKASFADLEPSQTVCWLANYPDLRPGDLIIEPENRRWNVVRVENFEYLRTRIRQVALVDEVSPTDIQFEIDHPGFAA